MARYILFFVVGAAAIVLGSNLLIDGGSSIAASLGVPERVIAVTMVAIGTSLPELITTITAIRKKQANLSAGNIIIYFYFSAHCLGDLYKEYCGKEMQVC